MPKCTIAIPVYNRCEMVRKSLESALSQKVRDLEILVVDNCSTDDTWKTLNSYSDPRVRLVRNDSNLGLFGNFNRCLDLARGQYLRFLCSDDQLSPDCINREIKILDGHPNVALLNTRGQRVDENRNVLGIQANHLSPGIYPGLQAIHAIMWFLSHYAYNPLNYPSGILLRRDTALQAGKFDTSMRMCGDVDFFLRVLEHGNLAVSSDLGCSILVHSHQEGRKLSGDTALIKELMDLTERYRQLLEAAGAYWRIKKQFTAYATGLAFKYWRTGLKEEVFSHRQLVKNSGVSLSETTIAVLRMFVLRMLLKITGTRFLPVRPTWALTMKETAD